MSASNFRAPLAYSCVGHAYNHLFDPIFYVVALVLPDQFGMPFEEVLALIVAGKLLWGFGAPVAGWLSDRWSVSGMIAIYFLGMGATAMSVSLVETPFELAAVLTLLGVFGSIYHPVCIAWLIRTSENKGRDLGVNGFFGGLGPAIAGIAAAVLTETLGWQWAFIIPGAIVFATGLLFIWSVQRGLVIDSKPSNQKPAPARSRKDTVRAYIIMTFTLMCGGLIYQATQSGMPKLFEENAGEALGGGLMGVGGAVMVVYGVAGLIQIYLGHLADKWSPKYIYVIMLMTQGPLLFLAGQTLGLPLVLVGVIMVSFNIGQLPAENVLFARFTPPNWQGTAFGFKFVMAFGVSSMGVPLVAVMRSYGLGFEGLFMLLATLAVLGSLAASRLPGEEPQPAVEPAE